MDQPLLSDLCAICLTEKPKYRCPRCKGRTCSLGCYKRHQQRASCSGKRDPTTYVKKAQWATPAGIDRDYNYLKQVERNIEDGSQNIVQRGIGVETGQKSKVASRGWQPNSEFQKYLIENRITIQHAPKGMSREKSNHTRMTKGGNLHWTIEWVDDAGTRDVQHDCLSTKSIAELDSMRRIQRRNVERRLLNAERVQATTHSSKRKRALHEENHETIEEEPASQPMKDEQMPTKESSDQLSEMETNPQDPPPSNTTTPPSQLHYYLLKPSTAGTSRVLITLDSQTSLTECLQDQILQEYPTIYALPHAPSHLPGGFVLCEQYEKSAAGKIHEVSGDRAESRGRGRNDERFGDDGQNASAQLDSSSILKMLKRDIAL